MTCSLISHLWHYFNFWSIHLANVKISFIISYDHTGKRKPRYIDQVKCLFFIAQDIFAKNVELHISCWQLCPLFCETQFSRSNIMYLPKGNIVIFLVIGKWWISINQDYNNNFPINPFYEKHMIASRRQSNHFYW